MEPKPDLVASSDTEALVEAEQPEQQAEVRWEFRPRQNPRWGTVTRDGLIVGRGSNRRVIPPDEVFKLAALGCTQKEIATWFQIPEETIKYNFHDYIQQGREQTKQRLRQAQLRAAMNGNVTMLIWLGKQMLGQTDQPDRTDTDKILPWSDD